MKNILTILILSTSVFGAFGQYQNNNFDDPDDHLKIKIDSTISGNEWQIGIPEKTLFDTAYSKKRVLITDTAQPYQPNTTSICSFRGELSYLSSFPYFVVRWKQKVDAEYLRDGGWIEASYDTGQTWVNIMSDSNYTPLIMGSERIDTLYDSTVAFTGTDTTWSDMMICWASGSGIPPFLPHFFMDIRFVFRSDSSSNTHEGWMIDNLNAQATIVDFIKENPLLNSLEVLIYPNPVESNIHLEFNLKNSSEIEIWLLDDQGRLLSKEVKGKFQSGSHQLKYRPNLTLASGNYFLLVRTKHEVGFAQFIQQ